MHNERNEGHSTQDIGDPFKLGGSSKEGLADTSTHVVGMCQAIICHVGAWRRGKIVLVVRTET